MYDAENVEFKFSRLRKHFKMSFKLKLCSFVSFQVYSRKKSNLLTEEKNQALVGAIPFCGKHPGPRFEDKFRSANQMDGISIADGGKMADS